MSDDIIHAKDLSKIYRRGRGEIYGLKKVSFVAKEGLYPKGIRLWDFGSCLEQYNPCYGGNSCQFLWDKYLGKAAR